MIDRKDLIKAAGKLKPLPESAVRLANLVAEDSPDLQAISKVVEFDPVLTGSVIRVANSAACGGRMEVGSVQEAVSRLGTSAILALAVRAAVRASFDRPIPEYGMGKGEFWAHSSASSLAAEAARRYCGACVPADASTSALIHDIGKLVLASFLSVRQMATLAKARAAGVLTWREAEREVLGIDHAELGGAVVEAWKVPETIRLGVAWHHAPERGDHVICDVVHLADEIAKVVMVEDARDLRSPVIRADVLQRLAMDRACVLEFAAHVHETFKELEESYSDSGAGVSC